MRFIDMKEIKLQVQSSIKIEGDALDPNCHDHIQHHFEDVVTCRKNAGKVIWAALSVEQRLDEVIRVHLFDRHTSKTDFFMSNFLKTNRVDFSSKRLIALAALKDGNQLSGKNLSKLEHLLSEINKKRNAFAHGYIFESTELGIVLEYYEGCKKSEALTDSYWNLLEEQFGKANEILNGLSLGE